jgi:Uma2 family endonuclease
VSSIDISTYKVTKKLITVEEYHHMIEAGILTEKERVELINGEILEMSPIGNEHSACVKRLNALFNKLLGEKVIVSVQDPVQMGDLSEPEPDIAILKPVEDFYATRRPTPADTLLIIEVADTPFDYDREIKLPLYAESGVPEYWIVNLANKEIEAHRSPAGDIYKIREIARLGDVATFHTLSLSIEVKNIF